MVSKSIMMIAYAFPPEGRAGVFRPLRFLRELMGKGWRATVLCCEPYQYERYDPHLLSQVPSGTEVVRIKGRDPWRAFQTWRGRHMKEKLTIASADQVRSIVAGHRSSWRTRVREMVQMTEACIYCPDTAMPWIRPAVREAVGICQRNRPDVLWATIGPISSGVVAYRTSLALGIPYVLDFRDPWGLDYYPEEQRRPSWARKIVNRTMNQMFERARAVVFMFESIADAYLRAFPVSLKKAKIHIIPNGFEGGVEAFVHAPGERCTILYAGTLYSYRYDTLLEGLVQLKRKNPKLAAQLRLLFVGEGLQELSERVVGLGLEDMIEMRLPTSHAEIRRLQQESHGFLVLGRTSGRKGHELVAGAKLFGYLQAARPIIGVVPNDETRRILRHVGSSIIADVDDPVGVMVAFENILEAWSQGALERLVPNRAVCETYSSQCQVNALVQALEGVPRSELFASE